MYGRIMTDFARSLACYGQQQSTGIPMLGTIRRYINGFGDFIPNRQDLHQSIYLLFSAILRFLYDDDDELNYVMNDDSLEFRRNFLVRRGRDSLKACLRARNYLFYLIEEYAQEHGPIFFLQEYQQLDIEQKHTVCVQYVFFQFWKRSRERQNEFVEKSRERQNEFVEKIVLFMEAKHDDWDVPQPLEDQRTRLSFYLMFANERKRALYDYPIIRFWVGRPVEEIERRIDYFLYCYHHYFRLGRRALPWHYDIPFHPRRPHAGDDDEFGPRVRPQRPVPPQIDGHGGDI